MTSSAGKTSPPDNEQKSAAPSISLPKGGGAICGIDEKFGANPVTGTGSMSAPIATGPESSGVLVLSLYSRMIPAQGTVPLALVGT